MKKIISYILVIALTSFLIQPAQVSAQVFIFDETDGFTNEAIWTMDADNEGAGIDLEIVANQGTDNDGVLRYNSTTNQWELSNDGVSYNSIATGSAGGNTLDDAYDQGGAGAGATINVDSGPVTLSGTGNVLTVGDGTSNDVTITFDEDTTDGTITWDNTDDTFNFSSGINLEGNSLILDGDNTGSGSDVSIIANQGSDNPGELRYNSTTNEWEISNDGITYNPVSTGEAEYFDAYDAAGGTVLGSGGSYTDIPLDTQRKATADFSHTPGSATVLINTTATYQVTYTISTDESAASGRSMTEARLALDPGSGFATVPGSGAWVYNRNTGQGEGTATRTMILDLDTGDVLKIQATRLAGGATIVTKAGGSSLTIARTEGINAVGGHGDNTLNDAYDEGGAGVGRTILVDSGPVELDGSGTLLELGDGTSSDFSINFNEDGMDGLFGWDASDDEFDFSNDLDIEGGIVLGAGIAVDISILFDEDGTDGSITWDNANDEFDFDSDIDVTGSLSASASGSIGTNLDVGGDVGIGISSPAFDLHLFDNTSTVVSEWIGLDDGTNQASILTGTQDPTVVATDADTGSIFLNTSTGTLYIKKDDGSTTNWNEGGFSGDLIDALEGTFGTPSSSNKFVTDTDPRLSQTSGGFGEIALGTRLDYTLERIIARDVIFYTRVFFPSDTTIDSVGVFTTNSRTGNINMGIYSDDDGPDSKLAETGTQTGVSSPINDFWKYDLSSSLDIDTAGYYWLALAMSTRPDGRIYDDAEDAFIPYRVESKSNGSTSLPATANPAAVGGNENLPYFAAFE